MVKYNLKSHDVCTSLIHCRHFKSSDTIVFLVPIKSNIIDRLGTLKTENS